MVYLLFCWVVWYVVVCIIVCGGVSLVKMVLFLGFNGFEVCWKFCFWLL